MQLQQLKYILEVERTGSMNKAAKNLFISQPNLSSAISNLEKELNIKIFERTNKGVEITTDGRLLVQYAKSILGQVEQLKKAYGVDTRKRVNFLEISQTGMINLSHVISKIYNELSESGVQIFIKEGNVSEVIRHLFFMKSEVSIVTINKTQKELMKKVLDKRKIEFIPLVETRLGIVVGKGNRLYDKKEVSIEELSNMTYIEYLEEKNTSLNYSSELIEVWSNILGNTIHVTDRGVARDFLRTLNSYSFNIDRNAGYLEEKGLRFIKLKEEIQMYIGWLKRKREPLSYEANLFIKELINSYN